MKNNFKRIFCLVLTIILALCAFSGCDNKRGENDLPRGKLPEFECGYFRYALDTLPVSKTQKAYIIGLTESGMEQTELIYPQTLDGYTVYGIGYHYRVGGLFAGILSEGTGLGSSNLKKMFFPTHPEPVLSRACDATIFCSGFFWNTSLERDIEIFCDNTSIVGWNYFLKNYEDLKPGNYDIPEKRVRIANVTYMYNYPDCEGDGYYWVDEYDESLITYIPPEPHREGYTFDGWFKEPECINEWDFQTDVTGKKITLIKGMSYTRYTGLCLYAKWVAEE